jgi:hypothetical protein
MNNKLYKSWVLTLPLLLFGCLPSSPPPIIYKDYVILTVLSHLENNDQKLLSMNFVRSLNKQLKLTDATYSYLYLCNDLKHLGNVVKSGKVKSISPNNLDSELQKINSHCTAKIEKLDEVIQNIGDQDTGKKIVVFIQIPWSKIDPKTHKILKDKFSNIKNKKNILKIYGFGGQGDLPQIADIFHGVPVHPFVGIDIEQTTILPTEAKKIIDKDLDSSKTTKNN